MFAVPANSSLDCTSYYKNPELSLPKFLVFYAISKCLEEFEQGVGSTGSYGVDLFITSVANEYFIDSSQIIVLYDESWDITEMLIKLESSTKKSFVTYYLPMNKNLSLHSETKPPEHLMHKLLPKGEAFIMFVKNEVAFSNMLETMGRYPWWNKRARLLIMVKDKAFEPTRAILSTLESQKIFNGIVVTEAIAKDNSTVVVSNATTTTGDGQQVAIKTNAADNVRELQIVALEPYPEPGHSKQSFVARWKNTGYSAFFRPLFQEKIDNLRGHKLIACVFDFPPLVIRTEISPGNFTYTGQEVKIFQEFARILNFTYEFYEPPVGEKWGENLVDNNWTGLIGQTQVNNADFGFASVFLLDNREQAVDVSHPYDEDKGCFAVPRPENLKNWAGLVLPFSWQVWACILGMAFVAGPIFTAITRPLNIDKSLSLSKGIFYAMGSLVSAQKAPEAKSHSLRIFIICWLIFCWLSFILYRVSLIVSLTTGPTNFKIDTIRQLIRSGLHWGGFKEVLKTFTNTTERDEQKLFDRFEEITNITESLDKVAYKGNYAVLNSNKYLKYAANVIYFDGYNAGFHITRECPSRYNVGFAMPIGSPFLEKINGLIQRFQSAGLIDKWFRDIIHEATIKTPAMEKRRKKDRGLTLDNMKLCYIIFCCGNICAFVSCLMENLYIGFNNRKEDLLDMVRRLSIISHHSHGAAPLVFVTDTEGDVDSLECDDEDDKELDKNGTRQNINDRVMKLHPAPEFNDKIDQEE